MYMMGVAKVCMENLYRHTHKKKNYSTNSLLSKRQLRPEKITSVTSVTQTYFIPAFVLINT